METAEHPTLAAQPPPAPRPEGLLLGRYRLARRLGTGGFGTVWLAHDEELDRAVALKRIPVEGAAARKRAEREALAAARLAHPGIVTLFEAGHDDDAVYLVSELVRGRTLARLLDEGDLSDRDAVEVGVALCGALIHAHGRGVIHRDVKPANVIVPDAPDRDEDFPRVPAAAKLTDFGIARVLGDDALTATGDVVGTIAYMAPEQAEGRPATEAADLYSAGLVVYEALSGINPIRQPGAAATARRVGTRLPPLARLRRDLPAGLCRALDRAVAPDPETRGTVAELRASLQGALRDVDDVRGTVAPARVDVLVEQTVRAGGRMGSLQEWTAAQPWVGGVLVEPGDGLDWEDEERGRRSRLVTRVAAGVAAGALTAAALAGLGPAPPAPVLAVSVAAAALVAVLPRVGWIVAVLALAAWLAATQPGVAVVLLAAALPVALLLPFRGTLWSTPAIAPLLGTIALAPAWPALAGQARRGLDRAGLAALGCWWALLAAPLVGESLLVGRIPGVRSRALWEGNAGDAVTGFLVPLATSGVLAVAALWALAAAILPLVVRGRRAAVDLVAATMWAAALAAATGTVLRAVNPSGGVDLRGVVAGSVVAGLIAVGARAVRGGA